MCSWGERGREEDIKGEFMSQKAKPGRTENATASLATLSDIDVLLIFKSSNSIQLTLKQKREEKKKKANQNAKTQPLQSSDCVRENVRLKWVSVRQKL